MIEFRQELAARQAAGHSMASQLFSTAVISGSKSVPNLGMDCITISVGSDGTPTIRPLETLHNALSLCQVDSFLEQVNLLCCYN